MPLKIEHRWILRWPGAWLAKTGLLFTVAVLFAYCLTYTEHKKYAVEESGSILKRSKVGSSLDATLPLCPRQPPNLKGRQKVIENVTIEEAEANVTGVKQGGFWHPHHCEQRWSLAIIVPYRKRPEHMGPFLFHMHPFLQRQELNYSIYFVEQEGDDFFNRARLLNAGFLEAQKEGPWDCVAFHDIDMLPEDDRHLYHCSQQPRHLAVANSLKRYQLPYYKYFGGACLMTKEHVELVNGWSNIYWGWGAEDDDMWRRIDFADMRVWRYASEIARYKTFGHKPQKINQQRYKELQRNTGRYHYDGLSNIKYEVRSITRKPLFTHIMAYIGSSNDKQSLPNGKPEDKKS